MIRRATLDDVPAVAAILNDPVVRPTIGGEGELDPTELIADTRNICLFCEAGGAMFAWRGPGIYEGHSFFLARGREALRLGEQMLAMMWDLGARIIWGATPVGNRAARWFNRRLGFASHGLMETPDDWVEVFAMEKS